MALVTALAWSGNAGAQEAPAAPAEGFRIEGYGTFNAALGLSSAEDDWRVGVYGRNLGNHDYWTGVSGTTDTVFRYPGMAREYGVRTSFRF